MRLSRENKKTGHSKGLVVAILTFAVGVALTLLWLTLHFRPAVTQRAPEVPLTVKKKETPLPAGWKNLEVKNSFTLSVPQDMKPAELIVDSPYYREAYNNRELYVAIVYGEYAPCNTPRFLLERPTYQESVIDIAGKKARLGTDSLYQPEAINARLCFLNADQEGMQLNVAAFCKDEHALETAKQIFTSIRFTDNK